MVDGYDIMAESESPHLKGSEISIMKVILGIDVGGSTTKIVGFSEDGNLIEPMFVHADDQITSIFGAFGKFTDTNGISLDQIEKIMVTGVGSTYLDKGIYGLKCHHVGEFDCVAAGGLYLSRLERAVITSLGTGTACVYADRSGPVEYMGGTGRKDLWNLFHPLLD